MNANSLSRKLQLLDRLQAGVGCTVQQLMLEFAISRRTVFRDIRSLEQAGVPVRFDAPSACYRVAPHFGMAPPKLSTEELLAVIFAAHVSPLYAGSDFGSQLQQAMGKLVMKSSHGMRQHVFKLLDSCHIDRSRPFTPTASQGVLRDLVYAIFDDKEVRICFVEHDQGEQVMQTKLRPRKLNLSADACWVLGRSSLHRKVWRCELDCIRHSELIAETEPAAEPRQRLARHS